MSFKSVFCGVIILSLTSAGLAQEPTGFVDPDTGEWQEIELHNANAADTTNANELRPGGAGGYNLTGLGVTVGVWDGGDVRATHQEFNSGGNPSRVTVLDNVGLSNHATHVAGTIGAEGDSASARGMASNVQIRSRSFFNDENEMRADALEYDISNHSYGTVAGWGGTISTPNSGNVSRWYGNYSQSTQEDSDFGRYSSGARLVDDVIYDNPHILSVWSAGNDRGDNISGGQNARFAAFFSSAPANFHESLGGGLYVVSNATGHAPPPSDGAYDILPAGGQTAKNTLVVGAISDHTVDPHNGGTINTASFSSYGGADDGRLGVDVVANGVALRSSGSGSDTAYSTLSGTSMSAPNATGTAALLLQHYRNVRGLQGRVASGTGGGGLSEGGEGDVATLDVTPDLVNASTQKGYIIHTATDVTNASSGGRVGPDYATGYGLVDGRAAADFITDAFTGTDETRENWLFEQTISNPAQEIVHNFFATGDTVKATLAWTDPAGSSKFGLDNRTAVLVHDLDLWIEVGGQVFYPWTLDINNPGNAAVQNQANHVDVVEQVLADLTTLGPGPLSVLAEGTPFSVHVGMTGGLSFGPQDFALLISGATTIPEPASLVLLALGGVALVRRRR